VAHNAAPIPRRRKCEPTNTPRSHGVRSSRPSRSCTRRAAVPRSCAFACAAHAIGNLSRFRCAFSFLIRASGVCFAKNSNPLLKEPLRQLRDVFGVFNQVANPNSTQIDSMLALREKAQPPLAAARHPGDACIALRRSSAQDSRLQRRNFGPNPALHLAPVSHPRELPTGFPWLLLVPRDRGLVMIIWIFHERSFLLCRA